MQWLLLHFAIGVIGTWLARRYALHRELIDQPGERRSHAVATPRGGGIAIVIALLVAVVALGLRFPQNAFVLLAFALGLLPVAVVGWIDDHRPLSPWLRLGVHALAAAIFAVAIGISYRDPWLMLVAFAATLVLTNIWNFMDGINGIAASQAMLVAVGLALLGAGGAWSGLAWALAAACAGFLPFNFPKARIFMGDVGSGPLGFTVVALLVTGWGDGVVSWPLALLPASAFLIDASLTLARRIARGERWWTPHAQHAYQVWARRAGHTRVTLAFAFWTALAVLLMPLLRPATPFFILNSVIAWYISGALIWVLLQRLGPAGTKEYMK